MEVETVAARRAGLPGAGETSSSTTGCGGESSATSAPGDDRAPRLRVRSGVTIRFGDGEFGLIPGRHPLSRRLPGRQRPPRQPAGRCGAMVRCHAGAAPSTAIENPFAIDGGIDPETPDEIRQLAPEAFRALTYRAVRPEDYAEAAERLRWVQRAGCSFRWTGSWLTAFVTPDPLGPVEVTADHAPELEGQLDRFRQAGREARARPPLRRPRPAHPLLRGDLRVRRGGDRAVRRRCADRRPRSSPPTTSPSARPLRRSPLEAAIQDVAGVRAVEEITFRRRGFFDWPRCRAPTSPAATK